MVEATYYWCVMDGIVSFDDRELSESESLAFLLEQADAPASTYVHKSMTAEGLAWWIREKIFVDAAKD